MAINQLTTSNTFGDWLITTNNLVAVANSLTDGGINTYITRSFAHANASFAFGNTVNVRTQSAYDLSNTTNTIAYAIHNHANAAFRTANALSVYANSVNVQTQSAYDYANTVNTYTQNIFTHANAGFTQSNTANITIFQIQANITSLNVTVQNAYDLSNTTNLHARSAYTHANASFAFANTANIRTQSAYDLANTANIRMQLAYDKTNSASIIANTDFTTTTVTAGTYGSSNLIPIITVASNGRIEAITNTPYPVSISLTTDTTSATDQYLLFTDTVGVTQNLKFSSTSLSYRPSTNTLTVPNLTVTGAITENVYSFSANGTVSATIDPKFGTIQILTLANSGNATINHALQTGQSVTVFIPPTTQTAPTWSGTIVWPSNTSPTIQGSRYTGVKLVNFGAFVYGTILSE